MKLLPRAIANALGTLSTVLAPWPGWLGTVASLRTPKPTQGGRGITELGACSPEPARRAGRPDKGQMRFGEIFFKSHSGAQAERRSLRLQNRPSLGHGQPGTVRGGSIHPDVRSDSSLGGE